MESRDITLWYIRDTEDATFHSIPFKSEAEAQQAINETELFESHETFSIVYPVRFDSKAMDRLARDWVAEQYEHASTGHWTLQDCWDMIDCDHHGGKNGFIIMSSLGLKPFTR